MNELPVSGEESRLFPLQGHQIVATTRDDEAEQIISRFLLPLRIDRIADKSRFRLIMNGKKLGPVAFGFNQFETDTELKAETVKDEVVIGFRNQPGNPSIFGIDDHTVQTSQTTAMVLSPTRRVRIHRPTGSGGFFFSTAESVLADRFEEITGTPLQGPLLLDPSADLTRGPGRMLVEIARSLATDHERMDSRPENSLFVSVLQEALIGAILSLPGNHSRALSEPDTPGIAPWMVKRAEEYMAAHVADPISPSDLVAVCGCSRSTLFNAFKSARGYTPMQFLASRRLDLARDRLTREVDISATTVAIECGFGNHGRFVKAYRARFGESPSETRSRCIRKIRT